MSIIWRAATIGTVDAWCHNRLQLLYCCSIGTNIGGGMGTNNLGMGFIILLKLSFLIPHSSWIALSIRGRSGRRRIVFLSSAF